MRRRPGPDGYVPGEMASFGDLCPDLARRELLQLFMPAGHALPQGHYAFLEFYCPDPDCDCQVVLWNVAFRRPGEAAFPRSRPPVAVLSWCWADDDPHGPEEEPAPQSRLAPLVLNELRRAIAEQGYGERIKAHYALTRSALRRPESSAGPLMHPEPPIANDRQRQGTGHPRARAAGLTAEPERGVAPRARLGTVAGPAVIRVRTLEKAEAILRVAAQHDWKVIVGVEPNKPERLEEWERLLVPPEPMRIGVKVGRNEPCPCGSGRKFKHCCLGR
ncbi:MAG TPA: SEC-C metal-binding domain-containing protein [Bacillota bacterium]|nr:SEC-C metal-binding domain-containing protein [Bacillota bacterium]